MYIYIYTYKGYIPDLSICVTRLNCMRDMYPSCV